MCAQDINSDDFELLLEYMYKGETSVTQSTLSSLVRTAEQLQIRGLASRDTVNQLKKDNDTMLDLLPDINNTHSLDYSLDHQNVTSPDNSHSLFSRPQHDPTSPCERNITGNDASPEAVKNESSGIEDTSENSVSPCRDNIEEDTNNLSNSPFCIASVKRTAPYTDSQSSESCKIAKLDPESESGSHDLENCSQVSIP